MSAAHRSAEVIAVASIIIYDVYQAYVCPFRPGLEPGQCILCGAWHRPPHPHHPGPLCQCPSADNCEGCKVIVLRFTIILLRTAIKVLLNFHLSFIKCPH